MSLVVEFDGEGCRGSYLEPGSLVPAFVVGAVLLAAELVVPVVVFGWWAFYPAIVTGFVFFQLATFTYKLVPSVVERVAPSRPVQFQIEGGILRIVRLGDVLEIPTARLRIGHADHHLDLFSDKGMEVTIHCADGEGAVLRRLANHLEQQS